MSAKVASDTWVVVVHLRMLHFKSEWNYAKTFTLFKWFACRWIVCNLLQVGKSQEENMSSERIRLALNKHILRLTLIHRKRADVKRKANCRHGGNIYFETPTHDSVVSLNSTNLFCCFSIAIQMKHEQPTHTHTSHAYLRSFPSFFHVPCVFHSSMVYGLQFGNPFEW